MPSVQTLCFVFPVQLFVNVDSKVFIGRCAAAHSMSQVYCHFHTERDMLTIRYVASIVKCISAALDSTVPCGDNVTGFGSRMPDGKREDIVKGVAGIPHVAKQ